MTTHLERMAKIYNVRYVHLFHKWQAQGGITFAYGKETTHPLTGERGRWVGVAVCSEQDQFCKATGRSIALQRYFDNPKWLATLVLGGTIHDEFTDHILNKTGAFWMDQSDIINFFNDLYPEYRPLFPNSLPEEDEENSTSSDYRKSFDLVASFVYRVFRALDHMAEEEQHRDTLVEFHTRLRPMIAAYAEVAKEAGL